MTLPTTALTNTLSKTRMHTSTALSATSPLTTCCNAAPQPVSPPLCGPSTELLYTKCPSFCTAACHSLAPHPLSSQCFCLRKAAVHVILNSAISPPQTPGASPIPSVPASNSEYSDASVADSLAALSRWDQRHPGSCGNVQRLFVVLWRLRDRWTFISFVHSCSTSYLSSLLLAV
jgi:hypothetical protein